MAQAVTLNEQFAGVLKRFESTAPAEVRSAIMGSKDDFVAEFDPKSAIQVGATLPAFELPNAVGDKVSSASLLAKGPILISFYRGEWCPFCNLELVALQKHIDEFKAKGVTLVAISPELPNTSLSTVEKHALKFPVLSDIHNEFARKLGIVWRMPDSLRPAFDKFGNDLKTRNGDDSFEVPVPATILVDTKGVVRNTFVDADYTTRLEPKTALEWAAKL